MKIFKLPDLGEGLLDAEIHEWYVKVGDIVKVDQPMVAMETAKAVVDVPAPRHGTIAKLYGKVGDIIKTAAPLVEFTEGEEVAISSATIQKSEPAATVVGTLESYNKVLVEEATGIKTKRAPKNTVNALPGVRVLAAKLGIELEEVAGSGPEGRITAQDLIDFKKSGKVAIKKVASPLSGEPLRGVRRAMANVMAQSHAEVVPVTLMDDADIGSWSEKTDITARIIRALIKACEIQPELNAWLDGKHLTRLLHQTINLGIAMDSEEGLFVPVLKNITQTSATEWRKQIETFKQQVKDRSIPQEELHGATIMLSNFGTFAGRYANPVIVPPCVAIIGTGRIRETIVPEKNKPAVHKILPLSITVDHRAVTGGEATRFLRAMIDDLQKPE